MLLALYLGQFMCMMRQWPQKVLNSFNATGSNCSQRRITSSNLTILHNIDSKVFTLRLVMGKIVGSIDVTISSTTTPDFDVERITRLFNMCYDNVQLSRKNREKAKNDEGNVVTMLVIVVLSKLQQ